jgi:DNA helicase-2/ATP-dependent DNA helicase PcrA
VENEQFRPEELEEERRLFYVGMTRAERLLYLTYASARASYGRFGYTVPSRFLTAIPDHLIRSLGRRGTLRTSAKPGLRDRVRGEDSPSTSTAPPPPPPRTNYAINQRVFHSKFGEGLITEAIDRKDDQELSVEFVRHGPKRLMASMARLDVIS